jgi:hypothetical protein
VSARFTNLVARRLGLEPRDAATLLGAMRAETGRRALAVRAAAFLLALPPVLPGAVRRRGLVAFSRPLLESPAARNLFCAGRRWTAGDTCVGLVRDA